MNRYRATVYVLSAMAAAVDGHAGITRRVVEQAAEDAGMFMAQVQDSYMRSVDDDVSFGPVTCKDASYAGWADVRRRV